MREESYTVTYAIDTLDPNPTVKTFDCHYEMQDWISEEMARRLEGTPQEDMESAQEIEFTLIRIE